MPNDRSTTESLMHSHQQDLALMTADEIVKVAEEKGKEFAQNVKSSQLRNFFAHVVRLRTLYRTLQVQKGGGPLDEQECKRLCGHLLLLKPKLAYAKGRHRNLEQFYRFMVSAIDVVAKSEQCHAALENFFALTEAVVAYHKFYGGRD
ncbi:MAG: type III-A CRISPR-associated protein Csm2 [Candidatus Kapabacteria bacterium]|nr:type III-A CRISPR-associated protein Csm2 [Candidatus Kapabacteria bacterium]